jgi:Fe-S-cluster containining protein
MRLLKNSMGRCVFHDGRRCTIYKNRPEGCRLYPFVFDPDEAKVVLDAHCPHHDKFQITSRISFQVIKLIRKLDAQRMPAVRSRVTDEDEETDEICESRR